MVAIAGFSSTALRPLLLRVLFPQVPAQGAYPRAGGAGPECQHLGLILASISSPPCRSRSRCRTRSRSCRMRRRRHRSEYWLAIRPARPAARSADCRRSGRVSVLRIDLDTVKTLQTGQAGTATLREVINRLDAASLNRVQGDLEKGQLDEVWRVPSRPFTGIGGLIDPRPHQRTHNGFGEPVRVPGCVALTGSDAGNVPTKPAIKFPSISRSALAASLGSSGCLSSGAGLNFSTM